MPQCQAINCSNTSGCKKSYFRMPDPTKSMSDRKLCIKWISMLRNAKLDIKTFKASRSTVVCEDHFTEDCFQGYFANPVAKSLEFYHTRKTLKKDAVPTLVNYRIPSTGSSRQSSRRHQLKEKFESLRSTPVQNIPSQIWPDQPPVDVQHVESSVNGVPNDDIVLHENLEMEQAMCVEDSARILRAIEVNYGVKNLKANVLKRASSVPVHMNTQALSVHMHTEDVGRLFVGEIVDVMMNNNDKKLHMNSGVLVKCSSVHGDKTSTKYVVLLASTDSTNAGGMLDWFPNGKFPQGFVYDIEPNLTQEIVDTDRPTPVLLIPNMHFVSSQLEGNKVKEISDPFKVSSYVDDHLTRNTGTENSLLDHDRVQSEQMLDNICTPCATHVPSVSEIVSSSPEVQIKSEHVNTISPCAVAQLVSVVKEEETEMLSNPSAMPATQLGSSPEVKMESMVHDSDGENSNIEPTFYDNLNICDVPIPISEIKKEPVDIFTSFIENGSEVTQ